MSLKYSRINIDKHLSTWILFSIMFITLLQIVVRAVFDFPFIGVEELSRYLFISFVFLGLSYYCRIDGHIKLAGIHSFLPVKFQKLLKVLIQVSGVLVFSIIAYSALQTTYTNYSSSTPTIGIPFWLFFMPTILGFLLLSILELKILIDIFKKEY